MRTASPRASAVPPYGRQSVTCISCAAAPRLEAENRPKPPFSPLPTRRKTALRQEISVFAARKKFLSAKKFHFCRTKKRDGAEKCSYIAFLRPVFRCLLTSYFQTAPLRELGEIGKSAFCFPSDNKESEIPGRTSHLSKDCLETVVERPDCRERRGRGGAVQRTSKAVLSRPHQK